MHFNGEFVTPGTVGEWVNAQGIEKSAKKEWIHNKQASDSVDLHNRMRDQNNQHYWEQWREEQARIASGMAISEQVVNFDQEIA